MIQIGQHCDFSSHDDNDMNHYQIFDANGIEYSKVLWCNIHTGEMARMNNKFGSSERIIREIVPTPILIKK